MRTLANFVLPSHPSKFQLAQSVDRSQYLDGADGVEHVRIMARG